MERRILSNILSITLSFFFAASVLAAVEPPSSATVADPVERGSRHFKDGRFEEALGAWNAALDEYRKTNDKIGQARILQHKAEAYLSIGQNNKAISSLKSALELADAAGDERLAAQVASSLGTAYLLSNRVDEAKALLENAVSAERAAGRPGAAAVAGNNLGNLLASEGKADAAIGVFRQAISDAKAASNNALAAKGAVNIARVQVESNRQDEALEQLDRAAGQVRSLPPSHEKAYTLISIGRLYSRLSDSAGTANKALQKHAYDALIEAAAIAESLDDDRAMSYAYGYLGALYEGAGRREDATRYTHMALHQLQETPTPEIRYRWQWQEGRLLRAAGDIDAAIRAHQRAVDDLQTIRPVLAAGYMGRHGEFRNEAGRLYLDLADLLLQRATASTDASAVAADLRLVRTTVEMLKGAELEDYFQDDCVATLREKTTGIDQLGERTAAIYPIVLEDRLEILVSMPSGMKRYTVPVGADDLNEEVNRFRALLEKRTTHQYKRHAQKVYTLLIQPLEKDLAAQKIDTLVFIPDGTLRTIPLAALYDGQGFIINRYAVATTPGLTLTDPQPLPRENVQLLMAGLTESVQGFPPLPDVSSEMTSLDELYEGAVLQNSSFTISNVEQQLSDTPYSIVHVASHGKFQSDVRDTFLLTFDGRLSMDRLEGYMASTTYRDQPVELLTLSACQTAVGDDKAALGLGGVAVKAGARSAVATLWYINDQASSLLVSEFYRNLKEPGVSKAQALQQAQLTLLDDPRFHHPSYWGPFLLIGNWL
jgi:CHAT domain-containing protein/Tfp pilus assembly protein PilF